jgi:isocitrate/isopropylmalate dehydrogenase
LGGAFGQVLLRQQLRVSDSRPPGRPRKHLHDRLTALTGERYKRTGEILPDSALEEFKKFDSIFLGAIGHPDVKPGILEVGILLKTRFALDQYINLRPVKQAGLQPRRRLHHVVRQAARVLRRNRHREPVRRHHH